jgi:predicted  nucleic acid-binding Zn-ribbon protein
MITMKEDQAMEFKHQIKLLANLQRLETQLLKLQQRLNRLTEKRKKLDDKFQRIETLLTEGSDKLSQQQKRYRDLEANTQDNMIQAKKSEEKLSSVKNNKEYKATLKEIEDFTAKNNKIEDEMLTLLEMIEMTEKEVRAHQEEKQRISSDITSEKTAIDEEYQHGLQEIEQLKKASDNTLDQLDPANRKSFLAVKAQQADRLAVAPVNDAVCRGCHMNIPPQMYNELQRCDSLRYCPHCDRIIYWEEGILENDVNIAPNSGE